MREVLAKPGFGVHAGPMHRLLDEVDMVHDHGLDMDGYIEEIRVAVEHERPVIIFIENSNHLLALALSKKGGRVCATLCNAGDGYTHMQNTEWRRSHFRAAKAYACVPISGWMGKDDMVRLLRSFMLTRSGKTINGEGHVLTGNERTYEFMALFCTHYSDFMERCVDEWRWALPQVRGNCYVRNVLLAMRALHMLADGTMAEYYQFTTTLKVAVISASVEEACRDAPGWGSYVRYVRHAIHTVRMKSMSSMSEATRTFLERKLAETDAAFDAQEKRAVDTTSRTRKLNMFGLGGAYLMSQLRKMYILLQRNREAMSIPVSEGVPIEEFRVNYPNASWLPAMKRAFVSSNYHMDLMHVVKEGEWYTVSSMRAGLSVARTPSDFARLWNVRVLPDSPGGYAARILGLTLPRPLPGERREKNGYGMGSVDVHSPIFDAEATLALIGREGGIHSRNARLSTAAIKAHFCKNAGRPEASPLLYRGDHTTEADYARFALLHQMWEGEGDNSFSDVGHDLGDVEQANAYVRYDASRLAGSSAMFGTWYHRLAEVDMVAAVRDGRDPETTHLLRVTSWQLGQLSNFGDGAMQSYAQMSGEPETNVDERRALLVMNICAPMSLATFIASVMRLHAGGLMFSSDVFLWEEVHRVLATFRDPDRQARIEQFPASHLALVILLTRLVQTYLMHPRPEDRVMQTINMLRGIELLQMVLACRLGIILGSITPLTDSHQESIQSLELLYRTMRDFIVDHFRHTIPYANASFRCDQFLAPELLDFPFGFGCTPTRDHGILFGKMALSNTSYVPSTRLGVMLVEKMNTAFLSGIMHVLDTDLGLKLSSDEVHASLSFRDDLHVSLVLTARDRLHMEVPLVELRDKYVSTTPPSRGVVIQTGACRGSRMFNFSEGQDPVTGESVFTAHHRDTAILRTHNFLTFDITIRPPKMETGEPQDLTMNVVPSTKTSMLDGLQVHVSRDVMKSCSEVRFMSTTFLQTRDESLSSVLVSNDFPNEVHISSIHDHTITHQVGTSIMTVRDMNAFLQACGFPSEHFDFDGVLHIDQGGGSSSTAERYTITARGRVKHASSCPMEVDPSSVVVLQLRGRNDASLCVEGTEWRVFPSTTCESRLIAQHLLPDVFIHACRLANPKQVLVWLRGDEAIAIPHPGMETRILHAAEGAKLSMTRDGSVMDVLVEGPTTMLPSMCMSHIQYPGVWVRSGDREMLVVCMSDVRPGFAPTMKGSTRARMLHGSVVFEPTSTPLQLLEVSPEGGFVAHKDEVAAHLVKLSHMLAQPEVTFEFHMSSMPTTPLDPAAHHGLSVHNTMDQVENIMRGLTNPKLNGSVIPSWSYGILTTMEEDMEYLADAPFHPPHWTHTTRKSLRERCVELVTHMTSSRDRRRMAVPRAFHIDMAFAYMLGSLPSLDMPTSREEIDLSLLAYLEPLLTRQGAKFPASHPLHGLPRAELNDVSALLDTLLGENTDPPSIRMAPPMHMGDHCVMDVSMRWSRDITTPAHIRAAFPAHTSPQSARMSIAALPDDQLAHMVDVYHDIHLANLRAKGEHMRVAALRGTSGVEDRPRHVMLVELERGYYLRRRQVDIIGGLLPQLTTPGRPFVKEVLMGLGKSSAITPALVLHALTLPHHNVFVVTPQHLHASTNFLSGTLVSRWLGELLTRCMEEHPPTRLTIITDVEVKRHWVHTTIQEGTPNRMERSICIADEHDMMTNPISSELNVTQTTEPYEGARQRLDLIRKFVGWFVRTRSPSSETPPALAGVLRRMHKRHVMRNTPHPHITNLSTAWEMCREVLSQTLTEEEAEIVEHKLFPLLTQRHGVTFGVVDADGIEAVPFKAKGVPDKGSRFEDFDVRAMLTLLPRICFGLSVGDVDVLLGNIHRVGDVERMRRIWTRLGIHQEEWTTMIDYNMLLPSQRREHAERAHTFLGRNARMPYFISLFIEVVALPVLQSLPSSKVVANGTLFCTQALFEKTVGFTGTAVVHPLYRQRDPRFGEALLHADVSTGADARIHEVFTNSSVCTRVVRNLPDGEENVMARVIARCQEDDSVRAFIDAGASITTLSSEEVARRIARSGVADYVGFIDGDFHQWVISTASSAKVPLESVVGADIFMYYDQANTTGVDVTLRSVCVGIVTLTRSVTKRDAAQAAFRMRGLRAEGQTLELWLPPGSVGASTNAAVYRMLEENSERTKRTRDAMAIRQFGELVVGRVTTRGADLIRNTPLSERDRLAGLNIRTGLGRATLVEMMTSISAEVQGSVMGTAHQQAIQQAVAQSTVGQQTAVGQQAATEAAFGRMGKYDRKVVSLFNGPVHEGQHDLQIDDAGPGVLKMEDESRVGLVIGIVQSHPDKVVVPNAHGCVFSWYYDDIPPDSRHAWFDADSLLPVHVGGGWTAEEAMTSLMERGDAAITLARRLTHSTLVAGLTDASVAHVSSHTTWRHASDLPTPPFYYSWRDAQRMLNMTLVELVGFLLRTVGHASVIRLDSQEVDVVGLCASITARHLRRSKALRCARTLGVEDVLRGVIEELDDVEAEESAPRTYEITPEEESGVAWQEWLANVSDDVCTA